MGLFQVCGAVCIPQLAEAFAWSSMLMQPSSPSQKLLDEPEVVNACSGALAGANSTPSARTGMHRCICIIAGTRQAAVPQPTCLAALKGQPLSLSGDHTKGVMNMVIYACRSADGRVCVPTRRVENPAASVSHREHQARRHRRCDPGVCAAGRRLQPPDPLYHSPWPYGQLKCCADCHIALGIMTSPLAS